MDFIYEKLVLHIFTMGDIIIKQNADFLLMLL